MKELQHAHSNCEIKAQCPICYICVHYDKDTCAKCDLASLARLIASTAGISVKQLYRLEKQGAIKIYKK